MGVAPYGQATGRLACYNPYRARSYLPATRTRPWSRCITFFFANLAGRTALAPRHPIKRDINVDFYVGIGMPTVGRRAPPEDHIGCVTLGADLAELVRKEDGNSIRQAPWTSVCNRMPEKRAAKKRPA